MNKEEFEKEIKRCLKYARLYIIICLAICFAFPYISDYTNYIVGMVFIGIGCISLVVALSFILICSDLFKNYLDERYNNN